jgi:hypothetical protein
MLSLNRHMWRMLESGAIGAGIDALLNKGGRVRTVTDAHAGDLPENIDVIFDSRQTSRT